MAGTQKRMASAHRAEDRWGDLALRPLNTLLLIWPRACVALLSFLIRHVWPLSHIVWPHCHTLSHIVTHCVAPLLLVIVMGERDVACSRHATLLCPETDTQGCHKQAYTCLLKNIFEFGMNCFKNNLRTMTPQRTPCVCTR